MKLWLISDTHNQHDRLTIPTNVDAVFHCGDESDSGNAWLNEPETRAFFNWFCELDISAKFFVPGNHSTAIEQGLVTPSDYPDVTFLIHEQTEWRGLQIFGSPYTPMFFNWSYMKPRPELEPIWQSIPSDLDILITHGPPKGVFDVTRDFDTRQPTHVGSNSLTTHVEQRIRPKLHAFGHLHDESGIANFGCLQRNSTHFINCSCCNLAGHLKNHGFLIEVDDKSKLIVKTEVHR